MKYICTAILALMMSVSANATLLLSPGTHVASGPETSQALINVAIAAFLGTSTELYKENVGDGFDTGSAAGWYTTTFSNSALDPTDADIVWDLGSYITDATHLLVKDGNHGPGWYLFDISSWDGMEDIQLRSFWPGAGPDGSGGISHVTIYGGDRDVPEPGPLGLLGIGMVALYIARRRRLLS